MGLRTQSTPKLRALVITTTATAAPLKTVPSSPSHYVVPSGSFIVADAPGVYLGDSSVTSGTGFPVPTTPICLAFTTTSGFTEDIDLTNIYAVGVGTIRILYLDRRVAQP